MIRNSRLDLILENNKIIDNVQINFTKNARTSDHMVIVKSLIDKNININGGKLYYCFVDLQKTLGSVIIPPLPPQTLFVVGILFSRCPCVRACVRASACNILFP